MKKNKLIFLFLSCIFMLLSAGVNAQEDSIPAKELVILKYFNSNNRVQYLILENFMKTGRKTEPLKGKVFNIYIDSINAGNLIATVTTDVKGKAKSFLPPSLKAAWETGSIHTFIAVAAGNEDASTELVITKAKIQIDTASAEGVRSITVQVMKYENNGWVPAGEVEMKAGIQRLGGILSAGSEETYTTDSTGTVTVEFDKDSLPGDKKGDFVLVAKVEDNDLFGNLLVEKTVPWGIGLTTDKTFFDQRTLWSTRFKTPYWLLFMAYSIVIGVWGTIIYLIMQIIKIKKLGKEYDKNPGT